MKSTVVCPAQSAHLRRPSPTCDESTSIVQDPWTASKPRKWIAIATRPQSERGTDFVEASLKRHVAGVLLSWSTLSEPRTPLRRKSCIRETSSRTVLRCQDIASESSLTVSWLQPNVLSADFEGLSYLCDLTQTGGEPSGTSSREKVAFCMWST